MTHYTITCIEAEKASDKIQQLPTEKKILEKSEKKRKSPKTELLLDKTATVNVTCKWEKNAPLGSGARQGCSLLLLPDNTAVHD